MPITSGTPMIYISDMDRAVRFYEGVLGMAVVFRAGNEYAVVKAGDLSLALHPAGADTPKPGANGSTIVTLMADEPLDALVPRLTALGARFPRSIIDDPPVRLAYILDPDGNEMCFVEMAGEPE